MLQRINRTVIKACDVVRYSSHRRNKGASYVSHRTIAAAAASPNSQTIRSFEPPAPALQKSELWIELTRQRALLLVSSSASLAAGGEPEVCSDLADQASTELEQDLAMQVRTRTFDKLRRIEHALQLMQTSSYGQCRRCHEDIPYQRLKVQPDALFLRPLSHHRRARSHQKLILCRIPPPPRPHLGVQLLPRRAPGSPRLSLPARRRDKPRAAISLRRPPCSGSTNRLVTF